MKVDTQPIITELGLHKVITSQSTETELTARVKVEENKDAQAVSIKQNELEREEKNATELTREQLEIMAQKLHEFVGSLNRGLEFSVDEDSGRDVIKVIDKNSGDVVRQYPSEEVLELVASLSDAAGNFVNIEA
jgi:flagellar protein FlaG